MRLSKIFIIPLIFIIGYLILISYPYFFSKINRFNSLGFLSVVDEKSISIQKTISSNQVTDQFDNHLLKGEKLEGNFKASEDNLGIVLVRFVKLSVITPDRVVFRVKKKGDDRWYYEKTYKADQFQPDQYFTFGFPPVVNSKGNVYDFEVESLAGTYKNGVGLSEKKPQVALVYKYSIRNLKDYEVLLPFIFKKLIYVAKNINPLENWQFVTAFIFFLSVPIIFLKEKKKITLNKELVNFIKKTTHSLASSKIYLQFFNTNTKKRVAIGLLIFLIAFIYRVSSSLVNQSSLFYVGLGGQGDYDGLIQFGTCALKFCSGVLVYDYLFLAPLIGVFFKIFGFIEGIKNFFYLMLILNSIIVVFPYLLLSRKNWLTVGGILGSLFLATNNFLTNISLGFPIDNGSLFLFSIFTISYFLALSYGSIRWLFVFGLMGLINGLNKYMFLLVDLFALILFIPTFIYEKVIRVGKPLIRRENLRIILLSLLPLLVFVVIYVSWEYFLTVKFSMQYFLRQFIETKGGGDVVYATTNSSQAFATRIFYLITSGIVMIKQLIDYTDLKLFYTLPVLLCLTWIFVKDKFSAKKGIFVSILVIFLFFVLELIRTDYYKIHEVFGSAYIHYWSYENYIDIFLFISIIFLFLVKFGYSVIKLFLPIITYVLILILILQKFNLSREFTHIVVWSIILFAYIIDKVLALITNKARFVLSLVFLILFIYLYTFPKTTIMFGQLLSGTTIYKNEVTYLRWVNSVLPSNAIVLGGGKSDLINVAENVKRPIIYSTVTSAAVFIPNEWDYQSVRVARIVKKLKNKESFKTNRYVILEEDIDLWRSRIMGINDSLFFPSSVYLQAQDYTIKVYKYNPTLKKAVYELDLKTNL